MSEQYTIDRSYSLEKLIIELPEWNKTVSDNTPNMFHVYPETEIRKLIGSSGNKGVSLYMILNELVLFHEIDKAYNSGYMTVTDNQNLIELLPVVGWERIHIKFSITTSNNDPTKQTDAKEPGDSTKGNSPYETYDRYFYIYAVDSMNEGGDTRTYTIRFASLAFIIDQATRLEKRYTGTTKEILDEISNIKAFKYTELPKYITEGDDNEFPQAKDTYDTCLPVRYLTDTEFEHDMIASARKPLSFIKDVVSECVSKNGLFPDCFFYQQTDGVYELGSYQNFIDQNNAIEFHYTPWVWTEQGVNDGSANTGFMLPKTVHKYTIKSYTMSNIFNTNMQCKYGLTGGITKVIDFASGLEYDFIMYYTENSPIAPLTKIDNYNSPSSLVELEQEEFKLASAAGQNIKPVELNLNAINEYYKMVEKQEDATMLTAFKQSPVETIRVKFAGADQTSFQKFRDGKQTMKTERKNELQTKYALFEPAQHLMRFAEVIFELNPCTDLKLGQCVKINMSTGEKEVNHILNGYWYIGKIKYVLDYSTIRVFVTCYRNNTILFNSSTP